jgi:glycine/D-amino acid oxidase-like deaminating enzyme
MNAIVVGAGLFGQLIARGLRAAGHEVLVLDSRQPLAGSPPAACLINPAWVSTLGPGVLETGLGFLNQHFTPHTRELIQFGARQAKVTAHWYDPVQLLAGPVHEYNATALVTGGNRRWGVQGEWIGDPVLKDDVLGADLVVVAAGYWSQALVPWVDLGLSGKIGAAWLYPTVNQPGFIIPWAPYKQIVGFDRGDGYWVSDGTAIKPSNYTDGRREESFGRCKLGMGRTGEDLPVKELVGIRPYTKELPCFCREVSPGLWVATGARKNGTLLGAWCADRIVKGIA